MKPLWEHQKKGIAETQRAIDAGERRICLTCPTGGGKSRMMFELILWASELNLPTVLYTNRRMLFDQISAQLDEHGIRHGRRASGHETALLEDVQLAMTQTELARVYKAQKRSLHRAKLVLIDEAHIQTGDTMGRIIQDHVAEDAACAGFTATPLDIGNIYSKLIVAGNMSELRACGALVPADHYGPDEPDMANVKRQATGEFNQGDLRKRIMTQTLFGRVFDWWTRLNPNALPTIGFACGVPESLWFAQQFEKKGVRAASIDGDDVYIDGETYKSDKDARDQVINESKRGELPIVWNRFVLREGIDMPWLAHGIFATVFGSVASYIQSGGRLLRAHPDHERVIIQDHGGNWWRHGSLNADREWDLRYTAYMVEALRAERMREKQDPEPIVCPKCGACRLSGPRCHQCQFQHDKRTRMVVQVNGDLKAHEGDIFKPRRIREFDNTEKIWRQCYARAKHSKNGMTFNQAEALFFVENHYYPPRTMPLMPQDPMDWYRKVKDVPPATLNGFEDWKNKPEKQRTFA